MKRWAAACALLALFVTGCAPKVEFYGTPFKDVEQSISELDNMFAAWVSESESPINTVDESRCYIEAYEDAGDYTLSPLAICGPYRSLGSEANQWAGLPLKFEMVDGKYRIVVPNVEEGEDFSETSADPAMTYRPDGKQMDTSIIVPEPEPPRVPAGEVIALSDSGSEPAEMVAAEVWTPSHVCNVSRGSQPTVGSGADKVAPPEGGSFALVSVDCVEHPYLSSEGLASMPALSISLSNGEEEADLETSGVYAVALSDDGGDSLLTISAGDKAQTVAADGEFDPGDLAGFYPNVLRDFSPGSKTIQGEYPPRNGEAGWHGSCKLTVEPRHIGAYHPDHGWAADGELWADLYIGLGLADSCNPPTYFGQDSIGSATYTQDRSSEVTEISLGGVAPLENPWVGSTSPDFEWVTFSVPADQISEMELKISVRFKGRQAAGVYAGVEAPQSIDMVLELEPLVLTTE